VLEEVLEGKSGAGVRYVASSESSESDDGEMLLGSGHKMLDETHRNLIFQLRH